MNLEPVSNSECAPIAAGSVSKHDSESSEEESSRKIPKVSGASSETRYRTKIHDAVPSFSPDKLIAALESDSNLIDVQDELGKTALHLAAGFGFDLITAILLDRGANNHLQDIKGQTPLHNLLSSSFWYVDEEVEDEDIKDFCLFVDEGHISTMKVLLSAGADVGVQDKCGQTPLHIALRTKKKSAAEILVDVKSEKNLQDENGQTPLHLAAEAGYTEIVKKLLASGFSTCVQDIQGCTPLQAALHCRNYSIANILVDADGENNLQDELGLTPLHLAAKYGRVQIVRKLLFCGAHPHIKDNTGKYPLGIALKKRFSSIVQLIISTCALKDIVIDWKDLGLKLELSWMFRGGLTLSMEQFYKDLYVDFSLEVEKMKHAKVPGTTVSYYDFARKHERKLALYLENKDIYDFFESTNATDRFPIYGRLITFKVRRARKRRILNARCLKCFSILLNKLPPLPKLITEAILQCLSERDMQNFIEAYLEF